MVDSWRVSSDPDPPASDSNQQFEAFAVCVPTSAFAWHERHESFYFEQPSSKETDCCASTYTQELTESCVPGDLTLPIGFTLQPPDDPLDLRVVASRVIDSARVLHLDVGGAKELDATRSGSPPIVELRSYCLQPLGTVGLGADPALGPQSAPVTLVEYGDFACPTCKAWHQAGVLEQARAKYGDRLRFVWRDFPIIAPESFKAAEAGQCANDQGKFWPYHDLLFERAPTLGVSDLKADARAVGLDGPTFDRCLDAGQKTAKVNHNLHDAESHGFRGTPSYLLNGQAIIGAPSLEYLETLIDEALASQ